MTHYEEKHIDRVIRIKDQNTKEEYILRLKITVSLTKDNCELEIT